MRVQHEDFPEVTHPSTTRAQARLTDGIRCISAGALVNSGLNIADWEEEAGIQKCGIKSRRGIRLYSLFDRVGLQRLSRINDMGRKEREVKRTKKRKQNEGATRGLPREVTHPNGQGREGGRPQAVLQEFPEGVFLVVAMESLLTDGSLEFQDVIPALVEAL
ncbi:hypothetical protein DKX38_029400 [Salix brachista]|uniref:Uncharacterized protein n=1 Tax=Salix brachista TaxID=2182728 RepID=A0A5N5J0N3_9ROSI|nr:hypothetical protein DKX38_029400 [Salix brachista]